ncbi:hypothetical protein D7Y13_23230 [Corallococcus praedator]|uniref:Uncharacterized protein n=1 Tax=Corallococcus praedator TaxID=2316724 RepID=A0ABX9QEK0_9BACT|nr:MULTISPECIES: hypothetical protein [Corallococcus]RKH10837.1 hypothetical protein D7X74_26665 [Corallococcus sp. CA047B]RKH25728.1 hypothetical protein D7X75_29570 [Corallococcus sp. CA031C]RKI03001.1 hypothetical protein D7Y13_23230 [Corallococcus praedator]
MASRRAHVFLMAASDTLPSDSPPAILGLVGFRRRRGRYGSATQLLWNRLENDASLHELCEVRDDLTDEDRVILDQCTQRLEVARRCLDRPLWRWSFSFWQVIHEVDGLQLLVMPRHMLLPHALEVQQQFARRVTDPVQRALWLGTEQAEGPLPRCVRMLRGEALASNDPEASVSDRERLAQCRHVLRGALGVVNDRVDKTFWQLSINVSIQIFSTLLLITLALIALLGFNQSLVSTWPAQLVPQGMLVLCLTGAAGAVVSNMLSKERFVVATGATSRFFAYHLLVKPVIGAFAALTLLFVEQSNLLLSVVSRDSVAAANNTPALLNIVVRDSRAVFFTLAALSVAAGYSADKFLSSIMNKVLSRLIGQSEKLLPSSGAPEAGGASPRAKP